MSTSEWVSPCELRDSVPLPENLANLPETVKKFMKFDVPPTLKELGRPARTQAKREDLKNTAYIENQEDLNIWYGKYNKRFGEDAERVPAAGHCNIFRDTGYTKADLVASRKPICLYFAQGICVQGHECEFYHRVPTRLESDELGMMSDIFGRQRYSSHKGDMDGVGSFNSACTTLYIGTFKRPRNSMETHVLKHFAQYGPVLEFKEIPNKPFVFVTYAYRAAAEFARVAMDGHKLSDDPDEVLTVKWAQDPRKQSEKQKVSERETQEARRIIMQRLREIEVSEEEQKFLRDQERWQEAERLGVVTAPYTLPENEESSTDQNVRVDKIEGKDREAGNSSRQDSVKDREKDRVKDREKENEKVDSTSRKESNRDKDEAPGKEGTGESKGKKGTGECKGEEERQQFHGRQNEQDMQSQRHGKKFGGNDLSVSRKLSFSGNMNTDIKKRKTKSDSSAHE